MDGLDVSGGWSIVDVSSFGHGWSWAISHEHLQVPFLDQVSYLILQLKIVFCIMAMNPVKFTILVLVSPKGIGLNLSKPLHKLLILDLHKYLGDGGVDRWVLYFKDNLIKLPNVILQAFFNFLVDSEEVGVILLSDPVAHEIGDKEPSQIAKRVDGIHNDQSIYVRVDSIDPSIQVFEFLLGRYTMVSVQVVIMARSSTPNARLADRRRWLLVEHTWHFDYSASYGCPNVIGGAQLSKGLLALCLGNRRLCRDVDPFGESLRNATVYRDVDPFGESPRNAIVYRDIDPFGESPRNAIVYRDVDPFGESPRNAIVYRGNVIAHAHGEHGPTRGVDVQYSDNMPPHQARGRARSLTGARGACAAHGARGNRDEGDNDNHHESAIEGEANAFGGNVWVVGGAPPTVISGTEFMQGVFTAIEQGVRNMVVQEMLVPARAVDTRAVIREGVNKTRRITHPKSQREGASGQSEGHFLKKSKRSEEAIKTRGILPRAGARAVTSWKTTYLFSLWTSWSHSATMHTEEEYLGSFGSEESEDSGTDLRCDISSGTVRDSRTTRAIVGGLCRMSHRND
ncbi:hypothetical protein Acr_00g0074170 [Actinidia rufa]|uniref:Uncharacterized protein n=1 Tax=Actinidia rufa TaxID=165716 RepID=A0A7J0DSG7_9ERIC|nr:hypothetical protein Acr_00g0074170 [Actinidia rufa]